MKKQDRRSLHPEAQEALRLLIADYLEKDKGTQRQAADIFQVSLRSVEKTWKRFKEGGIEALQQKKRGPQQQHSKLSDSKTRLICKIIKQDTPEQHDVPVTCGRLPQYAY